MPKFNKNGLAINPIRLHRQARHLLQNNQVGIFFVNAASCRRTHAFRLVVRNGAFSVEKMVAWALPTMTGSLKMAWVHRGQSPRYLVAMKCGRIRATYLKSVAAAARRRVLAINSICLGVCGTLFQAA